MVVRFVLEDFRTTEMMSIEFMVDHLPETTGIEDVVLMT